MIPKVIHITWKTKDILNSNSPLVLNGVKNLISLNPEWDVQFSDDAAVDDYIASNLSHKEYTLLKDTHIVEKTDVWRLLKLYLEGGLYIDLDRLYNVPLHDILDEKTKCVLPTFLDHGFSQDIMLSAPTNPIYLATLELILARRFQGAKNVYFLGPQTYMHAVTKVLMGEMIDVNPGTEVFAEIRKELTKYDFIKTEIESPPCNTLVYKGKFIDDHERLKRDMYAEFDIMHWTGEW